MFNELPSQSYPYLHMYKNHRLMLQEHQLQADSSAHPAPEAATLMLMLNEEPNISIYQSSTLPLLTHSRVKSHRVAHTDVPFAAS